MLDSTTLIKVRVLKHRMFRTDTTVVKSDVHHRTDSLLLQDGVKVIIHLGDNITRWLPKRRKPLKIRDKK
jgi:hypothetical protein